MIDWKYGRNTLYPILLMTAMVFIRFCAGGRWKNSSSVFTGNVKIDGDYDYINEGRETSTLHVESEDGFISAIKKK